MLASGLLLACVVLAAGQDGDEALYRGKTPQQWADQLDAKDHWVRWQAAYALEQSALTGDAQARKDALAGVREAFAAFAQAADQSKRTDGGGEA